MSSLGMKGNSKLICDRIRTVVKSCYTTEQLEVAILYCERLITKYDVHTLNRDILITPSKVLKVTKFITRKNIGTKDITRVAAKANRIAISMYKHFTIEYDGLVCPDCYSGTVFYAHFHWCPNMYCNFGVEPKVDLITKWCTK